MPHCAIKWCQKSSRTSSYKKDGITFHRFPKDSATKEVWINETQKDNFFPTKYSVICSKHFTPDCFETLKNCRRRLYDLSVPTLHLPILIPTRDSTNTQARPTLSENSENENSSLVNQNCKGVEESTDLTPMERKIKRQIGQLTLCLNKKKKDLKRLQSKTRNLKKKVGSLREILDTLKNND